MKFRIRKTSDCENDDGESGCGGGLLPGWEAVLWKGRLYVSATAKTLSNGSKEAFVSLLEYAEDVLRCSHVVVCLAKPGHLVGGLVAPKDAKPAAAPNHRGADGNDKETRTAIRNLLFLGFQPVAPGHEYLPSNPNLVCFVYTI